MVYFLAYRMKTPSLYIRGNGATYGESTCFTIFVDGEEVGSCSLLISDLSSYIASFYVFDLAYPTIWKKTMVFIQKIILSINDNFKLDLSILSVLERVNQNL